MFPFFADDFLLGEDKVKEYTGSMKMHWATRLFFSIVVCQLAGVVGAFFTTSAIPGWYAALPKPELAPPNWVFGPVWTILYVLMGVAFFLVWQKMDTAKGAKRNTIQVALSLFVAQLVLNACWSIIFFGLRNPGLAFAEIVVMWLAIVATMAAFSHVSAKATWLLVPYILWVSFAGYLNYAIWQLSL